MRSTLLFSILLIYCSYSHPQNTSDFFPCLDSSRNQLLQTVKIETKDTSVIVFHHYSLEFNRHKNFLNTITYGEDSLISTYLKEEICKKGLRFIEAAVFVYDSSGSVTRINVIGKTKINYPFMSLKKIAKGWNIKTKYSYADKIIYKEKTCFEGTQIQISGSDTTDALLFRRKVVKIYKKKFPKEKIKYEYSWVLNRDSGIISFSRTGSHPLTGIVIKNEWNRDFDGK